MAKHKAGGKKSGSAGKKSAGHPSGKTTKKPPAKFGAKPAKMFGNRAGGKSSGKPSSKPTTISAAKPAPGKQVSAAKPTPARNASGAMLAGKSGTAKNSHSAPAKHPNSAPTKKPNSVAVVSDSGVKGKLIIGTRGSALALTQSNMMADALRKAHPGLDVQLTVIKTVGDTDQKTKLNAFAGMGVFVKELQAALLDGSIDCAVHSLKDVPEDEPEGLMLAAFPEREDPRDVMVSDGRNFRALPAGSKIGTGSPRRVLQLKALRPDLEYIPVRGNVDTRINKVRNGELQGVILAAAGMRRLGRTEEITHPFSYQDLIPAIGQASLGIECRAGDARVRKILAAVDDDITHDAVTLERMFMKRIGGGCKVPMAAHVYPYGEGMRMLAVLGNPETGSMARVEQTLEEGEEEEMVEELALRMEEFCREKGIPLPHDLPEHHLLTTNPEANSES